MRNDHFTMLIGSVALTGFLLAHIVPVPQAGIKRSKLQQHNLSISGREAIQVRIDFIAGTSFVRHSHPGEEIIYVLEGILEYKIDGKPPISLKAGNVLFVPAGTVHSAKNVGNNQATELATYIVEKGKPLVVMETESHVDKR